MRKVYKVKLLFNAMRINIEKIQINKLFLHYIDYFS